MNIGEVYKIKVLDHRIYENSGEFMIMATIHSKDNRSSINKPKEFIYPRDKFFMSNTPTSLLLKSVKALSKTNQAKLIKKSPWDKEKTKHMLNKFAKGKGKHKSKRKHKSKLTHKSKHKK